MDDTTKITEAFLNRMLTVQQNRSERPLSLAELKEMALDSGMTEEDWLAAQQESKAKMKSGLGHIQYGNWEKALKDLEQAISVNPYHADGLVGLGKAYLQKYQTSNLPADKQQAENYAERALQVSPGYHSALALAREIKETETEVIDTKKSQKFIKIGATVALVIVLMGSYFGISGSVGNQERKVGKLWNQVEADFLRRTNLMPDIIKILNQYDQIKDAKSLKKDLEKLTKSTKSLHLETDELVSGKINDFIEKQEDLSVTAKEAIINIQTFAEQDEQKYRNLLNKVDEYKSTVNRAYVSSKKYNEATIDYNSSIKSFPKNILNKPAKGNVRLLTR